MIFDFVVPIADNAVSFLNGWMVVSHSKTFQNDSYGWKRLTECLLSRHKTQLRSTMLLTPPLDRTVFELCQKEMPEKNGVCFARETKSTSLLRGMSFVRSSRICCREAASGGPTKSRRSNLPGLKRAESRASGRFVAAITRMRFVCSNPSISVNRHDKILLSTDPERP